MILIFKTIIIRTILKNNNNSNKSTNSLIIIYTCLKFRIKNLINNFLKNEKIEYQSWN